VVRRRRSVQPHSDVQIGDKVNSWLDSIPVSWGADCSACGHTTVRSSTWVSSAAQPVKAAAARARPGPFSSCQKHMTGAPPGEMLIWTGLDRQGNAAARRPHRLLFCLHPFNHARRRPDTIEKGGQPAAEASPSAANDTARQTSWVPAIDTELPHLCTSRSRVNHPPPQSHKAAQSSFPPAQHRAASHWRGPAQEPE
jgi:hypothetical protein